MPRKSASLGYQPTLPFTPGSTARVSSASKRERRLLSAEQPYFLQTESREDSVRDKDAIIAEQTASHIDRPPPCPLPNARLLEAMPARGDFMDLAQDSSDEAVFDTPLLRPYTEIQGEDRPALLERESAPAVGNPSLVEPAVETMRSKSDPASNITPRRKATAKARIDKIEKMTVQRTDMELRSMIEKPIRNFEQLNSTGWAYVMQVEVHGQKLVKIGCTKEGAHKRADTITAACKGTVKVESVDDSGEIRFCQRAEALAKQELKMMSYEFTCTCHNKPQHTEYFDIDYETAVGVVRRWSTFCSLGPYNTAGRLSKIWSNRLKRKYTLRPEIVEPREIATLLGAWDEFVYVSWPRELLDDIQVGVQNFNDYSSPVCCMLFTLTLLQLWPDLGIMLVLHAFCILWFSAKTMTDNSSLFGRFFRMVFNVSLPWTERQLLLKGVKMPNSARKKPATPIPA